MKVMKIGFLITARLKSSRLKLKLLKQLNGYTVIDRIIQRAKEVEECHEIILCTSKNNQDLPLVRIAQKNNIYYFNGNADDVLNRLNDASKLFNLDYAICMTGDNPLFSVHYANLISDYLRKNPEIDFIFTDELPIGVNVYALKTKALETICAIKEEVDTEIWGSLINRPEVFNVKKISVNNSDKIDVERITLDEQEDYEFLRQIFNRFPKKHLINEHDIQETLENFPDLKEINSHIIQRSLEKIVSDRIDKFFLQKKEEIFSIKNKIYSR
jgi:spore coat polysaccharide biosynthesis protein SpsF